MAISLQALKKASELKNQPSSNAPLTDARSYGQSSKRTDREYHLPPQLKMYFNIAAD